MHKFYVSIFQIKYEQEKNRLEITSRIFADDLNDALQQKFKEKTFFGENRHNPSQEKWMQQYLAENFIINVNKKLVQLEYLSYEVEDNVVICYFRIKDIGKVKSISVKNKVLYEIFPEQQNIIQTQISNQKKNLVLTLDKSSGILSY